MNLHQLRADLLAALDHIEGLTGYDHVPARVTLPAAIITAGLPYLAAGDTYGSYEVRHTVSLVTPQGANQAITQALDDLIEDAVVALADQGHAVPEVGPGYVYESNNGQYLAVDLTVTTTTRF